MSLTATMTTTSLSRPHPPLADPPTIPLPPLPMSKTRKTSFMGSPETPGLRSGLTPPSIRRSTTASPTIVSRSAIPSAIPSTISTPAKSSHSSPSIPTLSTTNASSPPSSAIPSPQKALRKTVSIEAFPQPPNRSSRLSSLPPSPLSTSMSLEGLTPDSEQFRPPLSPRPSSIRKPTPKTSMYGLRQKSSTTSLKANSLHSNNTTELRSASSSAGLRGSDSLLGLPSPPWNRPASSSRDSLSNEGSAIGEVEEEAAVSGSPRNNPRLSFGQSGGAKDAKGNVVVSVRVRPDAGGGGGEKVEGEWMVDGRRSLVSYKGREGGEYIYDNVFSAHDNNARVYDSAAKRLVRRVMEGYNGTVFAYGMTGTGKTFSMQGTAMSPGVIPLAITDIFSYIRENPAREFLLRVSYLEIYNEKIFDLLSNSSTSGQQQEEIKLREDSRRGVYATPLKEEIVQSPNQLLRVISRGDQARKVAGTQFNARSSRSHAVVQIVVESRERSGTGTLDSRRNNSIAPGGVLVSTLSLIDLAGSEKAADNKERRTEGAHINKSLLTLGTVIGKLALDKDGKEGADKDQKHLPYRDSKLTRLLQPALSGGSLVSILCTIQLSSAGTSAAAASTHTNETLNTLKFASRAKNNIVSHAKRNVSDPAGGVDAGSRALLDRYRLEIVELRQQLDEQSKIKDEPEVDDFDLERLEEEETRWRERQRESEERHEEQMLEMQLARTALKERISHLNRLILSSKSIGVNSGRFSTASIATPYSSRVSTSSALELANSRRQSAASSGSQSDLTRTVSVGSTTIGIMPSAATSQIELASASEDEDDSVDFTSGKASKDRQIRTLQADLSDKNRYIATLEKRLIQARRSSHSRTSTAPSTHRESVGADGGRDADAAIREKDRMIDELRAKLDDQICMVTALRNAARKRDMMDGGPNGDHPAYRRDRDSSVGRAMTAGKQLAANRSTSQPAETRSGGPRANHVSQLSTGSSVQNFSRLPLTPAAVEEEHLLPNGDALTKMSSLIIDQQGKAKKRTRRSVDEMTKLLDEMIQEKVDGGQVVRGDRGSLRIAKRDTVMEKVDHDQGSAMLSAYDQVEV